MQIGCARESKQIYQKARYTICVINYTYLHDENNFAHNQCMKVSDHTDNKTTKNKQLTLKQKSNACKL